MKRKTTTGLVLALGVCVTAFGGRPAIAAMVKSWALPFPGSAPFHVAAGGEVIHYVDFDGSSGVTYLGYLDIAHRKVREMRIPYATGTGQELNVRPQDGAVFVNDPDQGELAIGDVRNRTLRRWPLPPGSGARSFTFDDQGRVLFLASSYATPTRVGRLDTTTNVLETWELPASMATLGDDIAWKIVRAADGSVFFNMNGFVHDQIVRLELTTGVFTVWPIAATEPVFGMATDGVSIFFHEVGPDIRRVARLAPGTGALTEWELAGSEFGISMVFQAERIFFETSVPTGLTELDTSAPGVEGALAALASGPVTPVSTMVIPHNTANCRLRNGHVRVSQTVPDAINAGPFVTWLAGDGGSFIAPDGMGGIYFVSGYASGQIGAINRFVP